MSVRNSFLIALLFIFLICTTAHAQQSGPAEATIFIDNQPIKTKYIMREGHLLVPALFIKNTGTLVDWNEDYRSVVFQGNGKLFALPVGKNYSDDLNRANGIWERHFLTAETVNVNGEPFVPLIDVVKKLGMNVTYDPKISRTFITSNIAVKPNHISQGHTTKRLVALTFDDGPDNVYTPMILDILKEKGVPATFFVVGRQITHFPEMMKRIVNENHAIGNHTWNHPDLRHQWSSKVREEIQSTQLQLNKVVGRKSDLFRPPYGATTKADIAVINQIGMRNIMWSVDTVDWSGKTADEILETVHRKISSGGIILQHNFNSKALNGTVEALPRIIDDLQKQGYKFVTIQTLLENQ